MAAKPMTVASALRASVLPTAVLPAVVEHENDSLPVGVTAACAWLRGPSPMTVQPW